MKAIEHSQHGHSDVIELKEVEKLSLHLPLYGLRRTVPGKTMSY